MSELEVIDALAKSVKDLDASRRVGWARSYSSEEKVTDLESQVISLTYQRDLFRRVASYMDGYLIKQSELVGCGETPKKLAEYLRAMPEVVDDASRHAGMSDADHAMYEFREKREQARRDKRAEQKPAREIYRAGMESLARSYRFDSVSEMRRYLKMFRSWRDESRDKGKS